MNPPPRLALALALLALALLSLQPSHAFFQSDELAEDESLDDWPGLVSVTNAVPSSSSRAGSVKSSSSISSGSPADKKAQFALEHSFGGKEFVPAGLFTVRVRETAKGGHILSKFRLSRDQFSNEEKKAFQDLLETDGFYSVRVPADVLSPGQLFAVSSVKARCLAASNLQERFDFHMDQGRVIGLTYSGAGSCPYPRPLQTPSGWTFESLIIIKSAEQALKSLLVPESFEVTADGDKVAEDGTLVKKLPEKSFWGKYWMYIVPIGLIVLNAVTQVANMPEEGAPGQAAGGQQHRVAGAPGGGPRRR